MKRESWEPSNLKLFVHVIIAILLWLGGATFIIWMLALALKWVLS